AQKVGFQLTDQFLNLMLDPFVDGRSGVGGAEFSGLASADFEGFLHTSCKRCRPRLFFTRAAQVKPMEQDIYFYRDDPDAGLPQSLVSTAKNSDGSCMRIERQRTAMPRPARPPWQRSRRAGDESRGILRVKQAKIDGL